MSQKTIRLQEIKTKTGVAIGGAYKKRFSFLVTLYRPKNEGAKITSSKTFMVDFNLNFMKKITSWGFVTKKAIILAFKVWSLLKSKKENLIPQSF